MEIPLPIIGYADFECINQPTNNPKVLFKHIPIAVGFYLISPFGNCYYSCFGEDCTEGQQSAVTWFVNGILTLELVASEYFTTNKPLEITPQEEESFQQSKVCWLCECSFLDCGDKVRDHDHLTGKYRGAAHSKCNINVKQKQSSFVLIFFHNFSGYDCHILFEELLTQAYKIGNERHEPKTIPKSMENYVSVQVGCLRFLDSYRFLSTNLDKLVRSIDSFPIMDENGFTDELFEKQLAYPYECLSHNNFQEPLNLIEDFWSILKQTTPPDEEINRTQEII